MNVFGTVWLITVLARVATSVWLAGRQIRAADRHRRTAQGGADDAAAANERARTADYVSARMHLSRVAEIAQGAVVLLLSLGGGIALIDAVWRPLAPTELWLGTAGLVTVFGILRGIALPFLAWRIFAIEARFGFNHMSPGLFLADLGKRLLLGAAIAVPVAAGAILLVVTAGGWWWLAVFGAWLVLTIGWSWARPVVVAPLFNRFAPLADPELERRVEGVLRRCGFAPDGVHVMDGSRRSTHLNASLTGFGRHKRIVFLDTLLDRLDTEEVEAVLAHELGHFRLGHVRRRFLVSTALAFAALAVLGWLGRQDAVFAMLGLADSNAYAVLALALVGAPVGALLATPLRAAAARRQEFEADAFALRHVDADALVRALDKIHQDNRADFAPDPVFTAFYATHPPLAERISRLIGMAL
jgi:STE24 endopeptidase